MTAIEDEARQGPGYQHWLALYAADVDDVVQAQKAQIRGAAPRKARTIEQWEEFGRKPWWQQMRASLTGRTPGH